MFCKSAWKFRFDVIYSSSISTSISNAWFSSQDILKMTLMLLWHTLFVERVLSSFCTFASQQLAAFVLQTYFRLQIISRSPFLFLISFILCFYLTKGYPCRLRSTPISSSTRFKLSMVNCMLKMLTSEIPTWEHFCSGCYTPYVRWL